MLPKFLTENYPIEKQLFLIPGFALRIIGFYPESKWTKWMQLWAFINIAILGYGCYAELYYGVHYLKIDVPNALDALCPVASSILSFIKLVFIWWYRDEYKNLIERVRFLTEAQTSIGKMRVKRKYFTLATRLNALLLFFALCTSASYAIRQIVSNIILYLSGKSIIYGTPFKMMFPHALLSMPLYPLTYVLVNWHGIITLLAFVGADGFFLGFSFYFATLLKALQEDLQYILADSDNRKPSNAGSEEEVYLALTSIIERHNEIASLTNKFSSIMVEITLSHFITSSLIIATSLVDILLFSGYGIMVYVVYTCAVLSEIFLYCLGGNTIMESFSGYGIMVYVVYTCAVLSEIFLYCLGGNTIMESSEDLATVAYCSEWYNHSVKIQKMVLLIIVRAQRTIVVKIPFFAPSFPALAAILRFTGSVVALAKSVI